MPLPRNIRGMMIGQEDTSIFWLHARSCSFYQLTLDVLDAIDAAPIHISSCIARMNQEFAEISARGRDFPTGVVTHQTSSYRKQGLRSAVPHRKLPHAAGASKLVKQQMDGGLRALVRVLHNAAGVVVHIPRRNKNPQGATRCFCIFASFHTNTKKT